MTTKKDLLVLTNSVILTDLNNDLGRSPSDITTELLINVLKYKHLKEMAILPPERQILYAMMQITGLTENDLDELSVEDIANIMSIIYKCTEKQIEATKNFLGDDLINRLSNHPTKDLK